MFETLMTAWVDNVLTASTTTTTTMMPPVPSTHNPSMSFVERHTAYVELIDEVYAKWKATGDRKFADLYSRILHEGSWLMYAAHPRLG